MFCGTLDRSGSLSFLLFLSEIDPSWRKEPFKKCCKKINGPPRLPCNCCCSGRGDGWQQHFRQAIRSCLNSFEQAFFSRFQYSSSDEEWQKPARIVESSTNRVDEDEEKRLDKSPSVCCRHEGNYEHKFEGINNSPRANLTPLNRRGTSSWNFLKFES